MLPRRQDWPERLAAFLAARTETAWEYGQHDCCAFVCDAVKAQTGIDPAGLVRPYSGRDGARRILTEYGGVVGVVAARMAAHGCPEIAPGYAGRGDVAVIEAEGGETCGIVEERTVVAAASPGLARHPRTSIKRAWRIG